VKFLVIFKLSPLYCKELRLRNSSY